MQGVITALNQTIALVVGLLCLVAIVRHPEFSILKLILRTWAFLAAVKLVLIWLPHLVTVTIIAQWVLSPLLLPELALLKDYSNPASPMTGAVLLSIYGLVSSGLMATALVLVVRGARKFIGKKPPAAVVAISLVVMCFATTAANAQSNKTDTLPAKTIKINPTSDVTIVASVIADKITIPDPSTAFPDLVTSLSSTTSCLGLLASWTLGFRIDVVTGADELYADSFLIKNSANAVPPDPINPDLWEQGGDFKGVEVQRLVEFLAV